ncbi:MAG: 4-alpha-glucanotransferase [Oscillospiraceae bacterium]|nr:4-alpha-glucanotransferase [Oscillospiraceae bacterium]
MRQSGILLPLFSLPSPYGIGTLGKAAREFVDFLHDAGQSLWQILPTGPTSFGNSPYQSFSAFAGNPYFIDPDLLAEKGLLKTQELPRGAPDGSAVDYAYLYHTRGALIKKAAGRLSESESSFLLFCHENSFWLEDHSQFMALKEANDMLPPAKWKKQSASHEAVHLHKKIQYLFFRQWLDLKKYANDKHIRIVGDLPIYVSRDSSDYYYRPELFLSGRSAACPPDGFNPEGQLWGNPIYDWAAMEKDGFGWWIQRLRQAAALFDCIRIDHFRGIYEYYSVKEESRSAVCGEWRSGPGLAFVETIRRELPEADIIAEDLGFLTDDCKDFFSRAGFPGMKVLQFAFDGDDSEYLPHNYTKNSVAYTGTHDNPTVRQWLCRCGDSRRQRAMDYLGAQNIACLPDCFIRAVMGSVSERAIVPFADWIHLGSEGRINTPGTAEGNWEFRIRQRDMSEKLSQKINYYTVLYGRSRRC